MAQENYQLHSHHLKSRDSYYYSRYQIDWLDCHGVRSTPKQLTTVFHASNLHKCTGSNGEALHTCKLDEYKFMFCRSQVITCIYTISRIRYIQTQHNKVKDAHNKHHNTR